MTPFRVPLCGLLSLVLAWGCSTPDPAGPGEPAPAVPSVAPVTPDLASAATRTAALRAGRYRLTLRVAEGPSSEATFTVEANFDLDRGLAASRSQLALDGDAELPPEVQAAFAERLAEEVVIGERRYHRSAVLEPAFGIEPGQWIEAPALPDGATAAASLGTAGVAPLLSLVAAGTNPVAAGRPGVWRVALDGASVARLLPAGLAEAVHDLSGDGLDVEMTLTPVGLVGRVAFEVTAPAVTLALELTVDPTPGELPAEPPGPLGRAGGS